MLKDLCRIRGIKKFIFASTCSVYGVSSEILDEESNLNPVSLYARTKIDSENVLLKEKISGFHPTVLRFATVFGLSSRPRFDLVVNTFVGHALTKKKIDVHGGNQWRPFVHTRDIARAIELVLKASNDKVSGQIFNVGDNKLNYTISDLAEKVKSALPSTEVVNHGDSADPRNYRVKFDKIKQVLNFECLHDIDMGIKELIEEFKDVKNLNLLDPFYNNLHQAMYMIDSNSSVAINRLYKAELLEDGWVKSDTPELEKQKKVA
jgi:nucleoside-diphosphate-sugar epimerase